MKRDKQSTEELRQLFKNKSDCYADTWKYSYTAEQYVGGEVIQAMTEDRFVEIFMEYSNQPKQVSSFEIDFNGNLKTRISIQNNTPTVLGAVNGFGDNIRVSDIRIDKLTK